MSEQENPSAGPAEQHRATAQLPRDQHPATAQPSGDQDPATAQPSGDQDPATTQPPAGTEHLPPTPPAAERPTAVVWPPNPAAWPPNPGAWPVNPGAWPQPAPRRGGVVRWLALAIAAVVLALCSGLTGGFVAHGIDTAGSGSTASTRTGTASPVLDRSSLASIAAVVAPSVVDISTGSGEGAGVILTADGAILTNYHVVQGATANTVQVTFSSGKTAKATIVGTDSAGDLAVIKAQGVSGLTPAKIGDSNSLQVGDTVLAIGSPLGLQGSVTAGIVSALHRTIDASDGQPSARSSRSAIGDAIQTDAAINPGNSGGALVNTAGEVIGINTAIATSGQGDGNIGVGFAIPSSKAKATADQLLKGAKVSHPFLGVQVGNADGGGAVLGDVQQGSPADKAGLQKGDVITKAGTRDVTSANDLVGAIQAGKAGDQLVLTFTRDGAQRQATVTLGEAS